jgi:hypothetical protein
MPDYLKPERVRWPGLNEVGAIHESDEEVGRDMHDPEMVETFPELKYNNDVTGYFNGSNNEQFYAFFDCIIDDKSKRYLSEDYAFCQRWLQLGGEIWVDLLCDLSHLGSYNFRGSYLKTIEKHISK